VIANLRPYPAYKDSGVPWLGKVPEQWQVQRLKWAASLNPSKTESGSLLTADTPVTFLPMERVGADGRTDARETLPASAVWSGFTYFRREDVLVAKITPCFENGKGACLDTMPTMFGFGSTEFHVLRAKASITPQFLYRLTTVTEFRHLGADTMTGAAGQQRVPQSFIADYPITLAPIAEQAAIVRYLDYMDRRIRKYIRAKQRLLALLNEQKQAIMQRAVTRGLDPNVRLRPSGVPWLDDIPEHWTLKRFKFIASVNSGQVDPTRTEYRDLPLIAPNHISGSNGTLLKLETAGEQGADSGKYLVRQGQVVYSKIRPNLRKAVIAPCDCLCSADMYPITPDPRALSSDYLLQILLSRPFTQFSVDASMRVAMPKVNREALGDCPMWFPSIREQNEILNHIATETGPLDRSIASSEHQIDLLREYRTRLIADVVTGKLDVREAAAALPDEPEEEQEPLDVGTELDEEEGEATGGDDEEQEA
jgi:type I restriction enzyme S subunit